ncbi:MAG: prenyltransferase/squalene oxidase repeat-containing protein [Planctomycetota bacterium]
MSAMLRRILAASALLCGLASSATAQDFDDPSLRPVSITPQQVQSVEAGLAWLATQQNADGSWTGKVGYKLNNGYRYTDEAGHVGVTSLSLMAFLAGGHLPGRGVYGEVVERGLGWILDTASKQGDGYVTSGGTRMYSHAFATLFLAEIYGMTHREDVRAVLQRAVDFIVHAQNDEGGWRYEPFAPQSDMSIVVCQVLALRAARNIGIRVPRATIDRAAQYIVDSAITESDRRNSFQHRQFADEVGAFVYQRGRTSRSSFPLTAAGVTALHGVGIYSDLAIRKGLDYLRSNLSSFNSRYGDRSNGHYFFWYGHYYGVQAMYTAGTQNGIDYWTPYFSEVRDVIIDLQEPDGSWPNDVGPGQIFGTAVAVLILEIPYRYLPIFQR